MSCLVTGVIRKQPVCEGEEGARHGRTDLEKEEDGGKREEERKVDCYLLEQ